MAMRVEVSGDEGWSFGKEDWSWRGMKWRRGLKLKEATRVEGWRWHLGHVVIKQ
jgi:hypothetical protein